MIIKSKIPAILVLTCILAANAHAYTLSQPMVTIDPSLLKQADLTPITTAIDPKILNTIVPVTAVTTAPPAVTTVIPPAAETVAPPTTAATCDPLKDRNCSTAPPAETTATPPAAETVAPPTTAAACDPLKDRNCSTAPPAETTATPPAAVNSRGNTAVSSGTASSNKPPLTRADPGDTVDIQTFDINPTQQQCLPAATALIDNSKCITPANAENYAAPEIVGNQAKIALIILLSTIIGLAVTIMISYLLNNVMSKRDLDRINKGQQNLAKKFASKRITSDYPKIIDALAGIIADNPASAGAAGTPCAKTSTPPSSIKHILSDLELFGTPETSQNAAKLLNLLGRGTQPELKSTAEQLSQSLKKDLGL
jgi:hypothetical protein